jgi:ketosteroid isomerase-like protein
MLSIEDRMAIQDLYARHNALNDTGDYQGWANCYTEDGLFKSAQEIRGRAAIAAAGKERYEARPSQPWVNPQHWNNSLIVEGDGKSATALCYLIRIAKIKATGEFSIITHGMYEDELVKVDGRWLFKSRVVHDTTPPPAAIPKKS